MIPIKRLSSLSLLVVVLLFAANHPAEAAVENPHHQLKISEDDIEGVVERRRKVSGLHEPRRNDQDERSRHFSHSKSINVEVEEDLDDDADDETIQKRARERLMRASAAKKNRLHDLLLARGGGNNYQQQQGRGGAEGAGKGVSIGIAEAFDYEAEVHGDLYDEDNLVDPLTGFGAHRRRIVHEGDTDENRRKVKGIAQHLDAKFARSGDSTPTSHDAPLPDGQYAHTRNDQAISTGPLGQKATRKIREHLISKGLIDPADPNAKLHIPHDLHLSEEDLYHNEDLEFEEVEVEVDLDENGNRVFLPSSLGEENGERSNNTSVLRQEEDGGGNTHSKSLSPSVSRKAIIKEKKISSKSRSHSYSHRRPLAGAKSRPITPKVSSSKSLRSVSAANVPNSANFAKPTVQEIQESIVVADLNAHEKDRFDLDDDDDSVNRAAAVEGPTTHLSLGLGSLSPSLSLSAASFFASPFSSAAAGGVRYDTDDEFEAARGPSLIDPIKERNAIYSSRRERMKAILREKRMFYAVQQPKKTVEYVSPKDWEYFVCQVCTGIAEEYSRGLNDDTASAFHLRLTEQAESNVTDLYTWKAGSHDAARRDYASNDATTSEDEDEEYETFEEEEEENDESSRRRRLTTGGGASGKRPTTTSPSSSSSHNRNGFSVLQNLHRGTFARTRSDNRWEHAPHTKEEGAIRKIIAALTHHYLVTMYEKEIFFRALHTIAATTRPVSIPSIFIREELCVVRKRVCPRIPQLYEGGKFAHLLSNLNFAIATYEREGAEQFDFIKHVQEERALEHEIEMEDEEDRVALLAEELERKGVLSEGKKPFSKSLGIGDVDEHGNKVIVEGKNTIGLRRKSKSISLAVENDPEAQEMSRYLIEEATMRIAVEDAEREERERLRRMHTPGESHEL